MILFYYYHDFESKPLYCPSTKLNSCPSVSNTWTVARCAASDVSAKGAAVRLTLQHYDTHSYQQYHGRFSLLTQENVSHKNTHQTFKDLKFLKLIWHNL